MFGAKAGSEKSSYDFFSEQNLSKWRFLLTSSLHKVQRQVHPNLIPRDDALIYIERLCLQLLSMLCASQLHTTQDVEDRVQKTIPYSINMWAIREAQSALEKGKKNTLVLPVEKVHPLLVKEVFGYKVDFQVSLYIVAVLEYIAADIFKLTGNYVKNIKHQEITHQDINVAMNADKGLMNLFFPDEDDVAICVEEEPVGRESLTYEEIVKDFLLEENQYIRDLNMIIKVFWEPFTKFPRETIRELDVLFSTIKDIQECAANLVSSIEDQVEIAEENEPPTTGICFVEIAEDEEFFVYEKYMEEMVSPPPRVLLSKLLDQPQVVEKLKSNGHSFKEAVKYVLPKLLLGPVYHLLHYFDVMKVLREASRNNEDRDFLSQALSLIVHLKSSTDKRFGSTLHKRRPWETSLRLQGQSGRQAALAKMTELQKSIDGWEGKDIWQSCNEFLMEGILNKHTGRRPTERHVFLFDGLVVLCKQNTRRSSVTGPVAEFKLKEKYYLRKIEIVDKEDTDEYKHAFEIQVRDHPSVILFAKNVEEKNNWMAALISLQTRSILERTLDSMLKEEEKQHPLQLPSPQFYGFAVEDSEENIVFEDNQDGSGESPQIKGGTLLKLVERLTFHMYADPKFVPTFLTTYRSFCTPQELLDLLVKRFDIPEPSVKQNMDIGTSYTNGLLLRDLKRLRKEYIKPVQFRVLNVKRHWVERHFYDFERDNSLLQKLYSFLERIQGKAMRKMARSIMKVIQRKVESCSTEREVVLHQPIPFLEWHLTHRTEEYDLMTLHPIEIARQVTLLEFDLYRAVQPSELVGSVWIKKDKNKTSPNLLKMIHHSTMFTFWLEKFIIESENFEERVAVVTRIIEILLVFQELNNFNGVLEIVSALNSAPVFRLEHTFAEIPSKLMKAFDEAKELNSDHFKKYIERLRSINPPCVPFLGMYLTNILLTEEGNPDFLPNRPEGIINFSKRRKVAEITGEIQQYQNQPYSLRMESTVREFFEKLNPLEDMTEKAFSDYLYNKSLDIEPRGAKQPPKFSRRTDYSLKSPGIKPLSNRHSTSNRSHNFPFSSFSHPRINEEDGETSASQCATPPTPSTPLTPPPLTSDGSVFTSALHSSGSVTASLNSSVGQVCSNNCSEEVLGVLQPPPLPPRRRDRESTSGSDAFLRSSLPPSLPPRDNRESLPPPVPPRRDNIYGTLTRAQSMSLARPVTQTSFSATLPRRNSERNCQSPASFNVNGDSSIPELPPKTYKHVHTRQQISSN